MIRPAFDNIRIRRFRRDQRGAVATEYAFVIVFIAIVSAAGMSALGNSLSSFFNNVGEAMVELACAMPENASENGQANSNKCKNK